MKYDFNKHFFDEINTEARAYWIGFIWCDGYLCIRDRNNTGNLGYEFKLSLMDDDVNHLEKFKKDLDGDMPIKFYIYKSEFGNSCEARLSIYNKYFGEILANKYGLIPHRTDCSKILSNIPSHLMKHFIRGALDADGSFSKYQCLDGERLQTKYVIQFGEHEEVLRSVEQYLIKNNLINDCIRKLYVRHDDRDAHFKVLCISGKNQVLNVLNFLYKDAKIYLDRKYNKYLSFLDNNNNSNNNKEDELIAI